MLKYYIRLDTSSNEPRMQQTSQISSLHVPPSFGQTAHLVPFTRYCSIHPPDILNWDSPLTACYILFFIYVPIAGDVSPGYSSGIGLEHFECGHHDPIDGDLLCLLCKEIKQSQGDTSRPRLPVTNNVLKA